MNKRPFTKRERYSIFGLVLLVLLYVTTRQLIRAYSPEPEFDIEYVQNEEPSKDSTTVMITENQTSSPKSEFSKKIEYHNFYPNSISLQEWVDLGFSKKQAEVILNFRESSGGFHKPEDLKKVYVISDEKFKELLPYMLFEEIEEIEVEKFDLNTATEENLKRIKGVGDVLSKRIIKYRSSIGGFKSYDDLENVYGLEKTVIQEIKSNTFIVERAPTRININDGSKDELLKIPLLNFELVSLILKERDKARLKNLNFISGELLSEEEKVELNQYLEFD